MTQPSNATLTNRAGVLRYPNAAAAKIAELGAPAITSQPSDSAVTAPATATFVVAASGSGLSYQWQLSTDAGVTWTAIALSAIAASYTTPATVIGDNNNRYRCVITNVFGSVTSNAAVLTVT